jgi:6-phosphogluconate dehydrogenase
MRLRATPMEIASRGRTVKVLGKPGFLPVRPRPDLDLADIAEVWRRGSVVASWLLDLTAAALFERFSSRGEAEFQDRLLSAMRFEFGGHVEKEGGR